MPMSPLRPCPAPLCPALLARGQRRCPAHGGGFVETGPRPSSRLRGYGWQWRVLRLQILDRDPICRWGSLARDTDPTPCTLASTDAAHLVPRAAGGSDDPENLRGLCHRHHSSEGAARGERWGRTQ